MSSLDGLFFVWYNATIKGADIMADTRGRTSLKIPEPLMEQIKAKADAEHRTVHNAIIAALTDYFTLTAAPRPASEK